MFVVKRNGKHEPMMYDKITARIARLAHGLNQKFVDPAEVTQKVVSGLANGMTTSEIDTLAAETAEYMSTKHPDYSLLAGINFFSYFSCNICHFFCKKKAKKKIVDK